MNIEIDDNVTEEQIKKSNEEFAKVIAKNIDDYVIKEILEDYKKLAGEITLKLDNTAEYESWLIIQDYVDKLLDYITNLKEEIQRQEKAQVILDNEIDETQDRIDKALHKIQLIQMDGEVSIRDLGLIVRDLIGDDKDE